MKSAPKKIFLDCEFTDFVDFEMISVGLVAESGEEFYAELSMDAKTCSAFVQLSVLPQLGKSPELVCTDISQVGDRLHTWFAGFGGELVVLYDFFPDYCLLLEALGGELPTNVVGSNNIYARLDTAKHKEFYCRPGVVRHHALWDARANLVAYQGMERQL